MTVIQNALKTESRFLVKATLLSQLRSNNGLPPFRSLKHLSTERLTDTYFDNTTSKRTLSRCGITIRQRTLVFTETEQVHPNIRTHAVAALKAKKRIFGDHTHSIIKEYEGSQAIRALIQDHIFNLPDDAENFGLGTLAKFSTIRNNFLVNGEFSLAFEHTDFGHSSGEITLLNGEGESAQKRIDAFLEEYSWLCAAHGDSVLSAYLKQFGPGERN